MKIKFNKKIYSQKSLEKAIRDYNQLANFEIRQNKNYFLVQIKKIRPELKNVFGDEFSNYVLSLMKK